MRIEKVNDNQIKSLLTGQDLSDRNMKISELSYGSEKIQTLLQEIIEKAGEEHDFQTDYETPLIIEAIPIRQDGIMIIMTKVQNQEYLEDRFGLGNMFGSSGALEHLGNLSRKHQEDTMSRKKTSQKANSQKDTTTRPISKQNVFQFKDFDSVVQASIRISGSIRINTALYKLAGKYYLVLENKRVKMSVGHESVLREYSEKFGSNETSKEIFKTYLSEYGEIIIERNAVNVLASFLG
ncbi:MAG: adaptor protein MecA [Defluviitaleaceae bacterium]|nr:adaptor protein MecA [Defluviitaleaceae bacterium]